MPSAISPERMPEFAAPVAPAAAPGDWRVQLPEHKRRHLRLWFWSIAATTLAVVVIGGITRLTQSGLSIVDWQPLVGAVPPLDEADWTEVFDRYRQFPEYRQLRPAMTLAEFKVIFFWEYSHRLLARLIGVVFLVPFVFFWRAGYLSPPLALRALALFGLGASQGAVGWLMVRSGLVDRPAVSHFRLALHLFLAFTILGSAVWLARELGIARTRARAVPGAGFARTRGLAVTGAILVAQIVWGAFVAGTKAGLFFNTFPYMNGQLVPAAAFDLQPAVLNLVENPAAIQWMHRVLGTALLVAVAALFVRARRIAGDRRARRLSAALLLLVAAQYVLGVLTLIYRLPIGLAVLHQGTAAVVFAVWVVWMHHARTPSA
jgi:cytochrome c oxidase assembly protein subunit 15